MQVKYSRRISFSSNYPLFVHFFILLNGEGHIMKSKKAFIVSLSLLIIMTVFLLAGCKKEKAETVTTTEEITKEEVEGFDFTPESKKITVWHYSTDPEDTSVVSFCRENPEFTVDNSKGVTPGFWPDKSNDLPSLAGAVASDTAPDLFLCSTYSPVEAYYTNLFMPLDDFLTYDPDYNFETVDSRVHESVTFDGKVYFAPRNISINTLVWNKDMFENVGLDPDKPPETWSELKEYCERLLTYDANGNIKTIGLKNSQGMFKVFNIIAFGEQYTNRTGTKLNLNTDNYNNTLEFLLSFKDIYGGNDKLPDGIIPAITFWNEGSFSLYSGFNKCTNFGVARLPRHDDQSDDYEPYNVINFYGIPKTSKNPRGGWKYLKFRYTTAIYDEQVMWYEVGPDTFIPDYIAHTPTRERLYDEFLPLIDDDRRAIVETRDEIIRSANVPVYDVASSCDFSNYIRTELEKVANEQISPKEFLNNAQKYGESIIKDFIKRKEEEGWVFNEDGTVNYQGDK